MFAKSFRSFSLTFITVVCFIACALGIFIADYNSAKNGFGEQHIVLPCYYADTGLLGGRIMGYDYSLQLPNSEQLNAVADTAYNLIPPYLRLVLDFFER